MDTKKQRVNASGSVAQQQQQQHQPQHGEPYSARHNVASIIKPAKHALIHGEDVHLNSSASVHSNSSSPIASPNVRKLNLDLDSPGSFHHQSFNLTAHQASTHPAANSHPFYNQLGFMAHQNAHNHHIHHHGENFMPAAGADSGFNRPFNLMNSHKALEAVAAAAVASNQFVNNNNSGHKPEFQDLALHLNSNFAAAAAMQASLLSHHNQQSFNSALFNRAVQSQVSSPAFFNPYFSFNGQQQRLATAPELFPANAANNISSTVQAAKFFINSSLQSDPNESLLSTSSSSSSSSSSSFQSSKSVKSPMHSPNSSLLHASIVAVSPAHKASVESTEVNTSAEKSDESFWWSFSSRIGIKTQMARCS